MTFNLELLTVVSVVSGAVGGGLLLIAQVKSLYARFEQHALDDTKSFGSMADRLARIETKIDLMLERDQ